MSTAHDSDADLAVTAPTRGELLYLLGSNFLGQVTDVRADPDLKAAFVAVLGERPNTEGLMSICAATAVLALADEGSAKLEFVKAKKLGLIPVRHHVVTRLADTGCPADSLEGQLHNILMSKPELTVRKLIRAWYGWDVPSPVDAMKGSFVRALTSRGLVEVVTHQAVQEHKHRKPTTKTTEEWRAVPDRVLAVRDELLAVSAFVAEYLKTHGEERLVKECLHAIASRKKAESDNTIDASTFDAS